MSLNLEQKKQAVAEISEQISAAQAMVIAEYRGLSVGEVTSLRAKAREEGIYLRVLKNTLAQRAVEGTAFDSLKGHMVGPLMYGIAVNPISVAKVLNEFAIGNDKFIIKAGAMSGQVMNATEVHALASLPSREELLGKLLGTLQAPITGFVRTLNEVPGRFVRTLAAVRASKEVV